MRTPPCTNARRIAARQLPAPLRRSPHFLLEGKGEGQAARLRPGPLEEPLMGTCKMRWKVQLQQ